MLAHRRLSILDLSNGANQPMTDPVTGQTIVFNGEIYNLRCAVRLKLGRGRNVRIDGRHRGHAEAAVAAHRSRRPGSRGMFAYGLWEAKSRQFSLARDPLGIKPLYVCRNPDPNGAWSLLFASEVRAILASGADWHPEARSGRRRVGRLERLRHRPRDHRPRDRDADAGRAATSSTGAGRKKRERFWDLSGSGMKSPDRQRTGAASAGDPRIGSAAPRQRRAAGRVSFQRRRFQRGGKSCRAEGFPAIPIHVHADFEEKELSEGVLPARSPPRSGPTTARSC